MARARAAAAASAAGVLLACASGSSRAPPREPPPEPALRIWVPTVIHWSPGGERQVRFAIENGTERTVKVGEPDPSGARVAIFAEDARACGVEPSDRPPPGPSVDLPPGDQLPVRVDLGEACGGLRPGEYRFELSYRTSSSQGGGSSLPTRYGTLVVGAAPRSLARPGRPLGRPPTQRLP